MAFLLMFCFVLQGCLSGKRVDDLAGKRIFVKTGDYVTDGTLGYCRMPDGWRDSGRYPYLMGKMKGGNRVYAADPDGMLIRERKSWYQDMEYVPFVRDDVEIPARPDETCEVLICTHQGDSFYLTGDAREEAMAFYLPRLDNKKMQIGTIEAEPIADLRVVPKSVPELMYSEGYCIVLERDDLYMTDYRGTVYAVFDGSSAIYKAVQEQMNEPERK